MNVVSSLFSAIAEFFGYQRKKLELTNTAPMQAREQAATDQETKDAAARNIAEGNIDQLRKDLAE